MRHRTGGPRRTARIVIAAAATAPATVVMLAYVSGAGATTTPVASSGKAAVSPYSPKDPYSPEYRHRYRHGATPTIPQYAKMLRWARSQPAPSTTSASTTSSDNLNYGGGTNGIGVTTGHERVYLVFYGSQWGKQHTNSHGDITFSGDPSGEAPYLQELFKGLGTNSELWSGVMTQYCQGVTAGSQSCPSTSTEHVSYPDGGALAGVWEDRQGRSPDEATASQLAQEAVKGAAHFGNTTSSANRDAQYLVLSPTKTHPDGFNAGAGFCAWHGSTSSSYGDIAYTNSPYITDLGGSCGANSVNSGSAGSLDGVSIANGHEYSEIITDQIPGGGWYDSYGAENADKCVWITPGTPGGMFDLPLATGPFAMQTTWANDDNSGSGGCQASHPIAVNGGGNMVWVSDPGDQAGTTGTAVSLQITATDSASGQTLTYSATGLPAGLSISSSGLISGTPTKFGSYGVTVKAADTTGAWGSAAFTWTLNGPSGPIVAGDDSSMCVDDQSSSSADGTPIQMWGCNGTDAQNWSIETDGTIRNVGNGKCMSVTSNSTSNGALIELRGCDGSTGQQWQPQNGTLVNPASGKCLDDPNSNTAYGTQLDILTCSGGANQQWKIP
jgi:hypothetical protein